MESSSSFSYGDRIIFKEVPDSEKRKPDPAINDKPSADKLLSQAAVTLTRSDSSNITPTRPANPIPKPEANASQKANAASQKVANDGVKSVKNDQHTLKTALPPLILRAIWSASKIMGMAGFKNALSRTELKKKEVPPTIVKSSDLNPKKGADRKEFEAAKNRFKEYSVFPNYPTQPLQLSGQQRGLIQLAVKTNPDSSSKAAAELLKSAETGTPLYRDLSPEALNLLNAVNLECISQHLIDIATLANNCKYNTSSDLGLGVNYFETEVYDTLSRGLAFLDKRLLAGETVIVPIKQTDGTFELKEYNIERFNLSGEEKKDDGKIDHNQGQPIFFLTPKPPDPTAPPLIVARGTLLADARGTPPDESNDGAMAGVQADGRKDISMKWVVENKELADKMGEISKDHGAFKVCGHSLGGNVATMLSVRFHDQIDSTMTISAPHVSKDVYDIWKTIPLDQRPQVTNILVEGDLVPSGGDRIIGMAVLAEQQDAEGRPDHASNPVERHLKPFNNGNVRYAAVDKQEEEYKIIRKLNTFDITAVGRALQKKEGWEKITGTGDRARDLLEFQDAVTSSVNANTQLKDSDIDLQKSKYEQLKPKEKQEMMARIERASPAKLNEIGIENIINFLGAEKPSCELYLKLKIAQAANSDSYQIPEDKIPEGNSFQLYNAQFDLYKAP